MVADAETRRHQGRGKAGEARLPLKGPISPAAISDGLGACGLTHRLSVLASLPLLCWESAARLHTGGLEGGSALRGPASPWARPAPQGEVGPCEQP